MIIAQVARMLFIGLEKENIRLLQEDKPINFKADDIGFPGLEVVIITGEDNKDILEKMHKAGIIFNHDCIFSNDCI